jgi:hypothetical protein
MIYSDLPFVPSAAVSSKAFSSDLFPFMPWNISRLKSNLGMFLVPLHQQASA